MINISYRGLSMSNWGSDGWLICKNEDEKKKCVCYFVISALEVWCLDKLYRPREYLHFYVFRNR